ncbi:hypothetical protein DX908_08240 [Parvularcula marina]|uniref:Uncharacterized protein n=1 Tax=Parvularcula marina TaxID=2292771 RepID=A0A371RIH4_9PROT|nr:hypothetical protein DX908_08240 [Parvularcula marina]
MAVLRIFAWILVALALMLLGYDAVSTLDEGIPVITTTAEFMNIAGLELSVPEGGVGKFFLDLPLWTLIGVPGVILTLVFRPVN